MPSVRTEDRASHPRLWKLARWPTSVICIYLVARGLVELLEHSYAFEFIRAAPQLRPFEHLTTGATHLFALGWILVAASVPILILVGLLSPTEFGEFARTMGLYRNGAIALNAPRRVHYPPSPGDALVEETSTQEPVVAWRFWMLVGDTLQGAREVWTDRVKHAKCGVCAEVPGVSCTCGIYAFSVKPDALQFGYDEAWIPGRVELSGVVIEHELGYRAQTARILELWVPDIDIAAAFERRYGCFVNTG